MRAQSHVVGVALMLGLTVAALGGLTVAVGSVIDAQTASVDATRIADEMDVTLQPLETTGPEAGTLHFADGNLGTVNRELRILENGSVIDRRSIGALVFEAEDRRVAFLGGAIVRGRASGAWLAAEPPIVASERNGVLVAGVARLGAGDVAVGTEQATQVTLRTNVSHSRLDLGRGRFAVAIETTTPRPFERYFADQNVSLSRTDFDGDGIESVVANYSGQRRGYRVIHNLSLEVAHG
jgi:hypothetical protein